MNGYLETTLIECSRQSSEQALVNNEENTSLWTNNLTNVYHLNAGDKVSVYSSFVSEKGAGSLDTIEIKGVSLRKTKSFTYTKDNTALVNASNGTNENGFITNGLKGDFTNVIKQYYEEVTEEIELRDDTINIVIDYHKTSDGNGYTQLPRHFIERRPTFPQIGQAPVGNPPLATDPNYYKSFAYGGDSCWLQGETGGSLSRSQHNPPQGFPWAHEDTTYTGRAQFQTGTTPNTWIPLQFLQADYRLDPNNNGEYLRMKQDNSKFTIFTRNNVVINDLEYPPIQVPFTEVGEPMVLKYLTIAPESFDYTWYREKKEIKLNNGFISAQFVADEISRQLRKVISDYNIVSTYTENDSDVDRIYKQNISKIIETETYKTFFTSTAEFTEANYLVTRAYNTANAGLSAWFSNFNTVGIKRPEIWTTGRKININASVTFNELNPTEVEIDWSEAGTQYSKRMRGMFVAEQYQNWDETVFEPLVLAVKYTKANVDLLRDFIQSQELYPEIFDSWKYEKDDPQNSVSYYDKTQTINNTRWFHMNPPTSQPLEFGGVEYNFTNASDKWNSDIMLDNVALSTDDIVQQYEKRRDNIDKIYLGYGSYRGQVGGSQSRDLLSKIILARYDPTQRDNFYDNPQIIRDELSYGCFGKDKNGLITIVVDYSTPATATEPAYALEFPPTMMISNTDQTIPVVEFGRKIGFDEHFTAFGTLAIALEGGYGKGVNFLGPEKTYPSDAKRSINLAYNSIKRYIGSVNPEVGWDGQHFYIAGLHTDMKIGNNLLSGSNIAKQNRNANGTFLPQTGMMNAVESPADVPLNVCYRINPREDFREFCVERCPYTYPELLYSANGTKGDSFESTIIPGYGPLVLDLQPTWTYRRLNKNLEPWNIYDSPTGIGIIDLGFTSETWNQSVWNTLGFSYKQFHSSTNNRLQRITPNNINDLSYVTTNSLVSAKDTSSWVVNDGSIPLIGENLAFDTFMFHYWSDGVLYGNSQTKDPIAVQPEIIQLTSSIQLVADNFPINMKRGYYTIRSDIVPNSSYVGGKPDNTNMPIVGIINKENPQSDFYFAQQSGLEFVITRPTILSSVTISLHDPDGTFAKTSSDSSIIFKIDKINNSSLDIVNEILNEKKK